jgi:hypothetical protein
MILDDLLPLQHDDGQALLERLAAEPSLEDDLPALIDRYRRDYPAELVRAAFTQARLRRRARRKFSQADALWFTPDGLEMASSDIVARHTAARFAGLPWVLDLCCGVGGDALALADVASRVTAVDRDPLALACCRANARVLHFDRTLEVVQAEVESFVDNLGLFGRPSAIFVDPSRRESRTAARDPERYSPPISWCRGLIRVAERVAIKVSPALDFDAALAGMTAEIEVIGLHGECKEAILWLGGFRTVARRATVLPAGATLTDEGPSSDALGGVGAWLFEPAGAVIRAGLLQRLAGEHALRRIEPSIAYLTGEAPIASPFLVGYPVCEVIPWGLKRLNAALTARKIGQVVIKKRGFPLIPEQLRPKLKLAGPHRATLICTRAGGKPVVILAGDAAER